MISAPSSPTEALTIGCILRPAATALTRKGIIVSLMPWLS
jgi:hypothetical protein